MNQDIYCGTFMELQELQPASHGFDPFNLAQASTNAAASYEMTGVAAGGDGALGGIAVAAEPAPAPTPVPGPDHTGEHEHKKRNLKDRYESMSACETPLEPSTLLPVPIPTKRKASSYGTPSAYDDDSEDVRSTRTAPDKKQNHSEIEKRRRDKMNTYISELSAMIPMCSAMSRKLDKLTVLRMAVQHLRTVRGAPAACPLSVNPRPAALSDRELNSLVLHAAQDTFLLVVGCDRGRLLYVSESVTSMLHYQQSELLGHSMFDILHPKDVAKVKEQLSSSDLSPRERLIDAKTMMPVQEVMGAGASRFCPGARRSFFCRIKCKSTSDLHRVKEDPECSGELHKKRSHEKKYRVVQCTGYLKSWAPAEVAEGGECDESGAGSLSCLVAVGRALPDPARDLSDPPRAPPFTRPMQFVSRHAIDGKYLFVDQRVTPALGFLAQELVGTSLYEHVSGRELAAVARAHKAALESRAPHRTPPYCVRRKDGSAALLQTLFKPFRNPWTKDMECLLAQNTLVSDARAGRVAADASTHAYAEGVSGMSVDGGSEGDAEVQRLIESRVESHKIGSAIAEEALRRNSAELSPLSLPPELLQDAFNTRPLLSDGEEGGGGGGGAAGPPGGEGEGEYPPDAGSPDGNGEAAIAVIMSLLEADAGLGGPVNYTGLPWPLP